MKLEYSSQEFFTTKPGNIVVEEDPDRIYFLDKKTGRVLAFGKPEA